MVATARIASPRRDALASCYCLRPAGAKQTRWKFIDVYRVRHKNVPVKIFINIFPTENCKIKLYATIVCSYVRKITKFYSVVSNCNKAMPYEARSTSEFLRITREKREKLRYLCNTTTDLHTIFNMMTQIVSLKRMAVKHLIRYSMMMDSRHLENRKIAISRDDAERLSQAYRPSAILDF